MIDVRYHEQQLAVAGYAVLTDERYGQLLDSHDTLTRARELARTVVDGREGGFSTREFAFKAELALLDLLTGEGQ